MFDVTFIPPKRASRDAGRKIKFWTDSAGTVAAEVFSAAGAALTQPVKVPANGHLNVKFETWPIYYSDNQSWKTVKPLPGYNEGNAVVYDRVFTLAEVNAGTAELIPARAGKQFFPTHAAMMVPGTNIGGATLVRIIEETSGTVILSHAVADLNSHAWGYITGGTVAAGGIGAFTTAGKKILVDKTGSAATGADGGLRCIVAGFWV